MNDTPSFCIVYLASPRDFKVSNLNRRDFLRTSLEITKTHFPTTDIYVFHEDYTDEDKASFLPVTEYIQIDFTGHDDEYKAEVCKRPKGYMMMNRFYSGIMQSYPQIQKYTHYMRLDDDSFFIEPFINEEHVKKNLLKHDYVYRTVYTEEGTVQRHQELYQFTLDFLREEGYGQHIPTLINHLKTTAFLRPDGSYSCDAPYNNFHMASQRLWTNPLVQRYLKKIESVNGILGKGWYETPIQAMISKVLTLFIGMKIYHDGSFGYRHNIHFSKLNSEGYVMIEDSPFYPGTEERYRS